MVTNLNFYYLYKRRPRLTSMDFLGLDLTRDSAAERASITFQFLVRNSCDQSRNNNNNDNNNNKAECRNKIRINLQNIQSNKFKKNIKQN